MFGAECKGRVPVRLVEASDEVRAALGWTKGQEKDCLITQKMARMTMNIIMPMHSMRVMTYQVGMEIFDAIKSWK